MSKFDQKIFFASANTTHGFKNYFPDVFDPTKIEKIYIIKGGPGTGKSGFMRCICQHAREKELCTEEFLCSSDPNSLDGIIIGERKIAILDGTSPHATDPVYPGAVEEIINFGDFLDRSVLYQHKSEIIFLIQEKKRYYKRAYQFMKAMGEIESEIAKIGQEAALLEKMDKNLDAISKKVFVSSSDFEEKIRNLSAINAKGRIKLETYQNMAKHIFLIEDHNDTGYLYLQRLHQLAKEKKQAVTISFSCTFPDQIDALYFPGSSSAFIMGERSYEKEIPGKTYQYINMKRFADKEHIQANRQKIRFGVRCSEMLLGGAVDAFSEAEKAHHALEKIYIQAMNFQRLSQLIQDFSKKNELI